MKIPLSNLAILSLAQAMTCAAQPWEAVTTELLAAEKPGYGGLSGLVVDHQTGEILVYLSDLGIFRSGDQGTTWERATKTALKGRTESPGCLLLDPTARTKTLLAALVYGAPVSVSIDSGKSFSPLGEASAHVDWCAVDWSDPSHQFVLALKHEMGGLMIASNDGGKSFREVGEGFISGWVFDRQTAVVAKEGTEGEPEPALMRTTDGGKSFSHCGNFTPVGGHSSRALPRWHDGKLFWLTKQGLITSTDKGATWQVIATIDKAAYGPVPGKDKDHLFVLTRDGIIESKDAGKTWSAPAAGPDDLIGHGELTWLEYDPVNDILYLTRMGRELYRLRRR